MAGPLICVWQWWVFLHQVITRGNKFFLLDDIGQELLFVHTFCSQPALLPDPYPDHKARFCHGSKCYTLLVLSLDLYWTKNHSHPNSSVCISPFFSLPSHWLSPSKTYKREADYYYHFNCRGREKKKKLNQSFMLPDWVASTNDLYILNMKWIVKTMS